MRILTFKATKEGTLAYELLEDSVGALRSIGQDVYVLDLYKERLKDTQDLAGAVYKAIKLHRPNFVFTITYFGLVPELFDQLRLPYVAWVTSDPLTKGLPKPSPYFYLFISEKGAVDEVRRFGYKKVHHLPLAADPKRYVPIPKDGGRLEEYECDVSFLGNAGPTWDEKYERNGDFISREEGERIIERARRNPSLSAILLFLLVKKNLSLKDAQRLEEWLKFSSIEKALKIKQIIEPIRFKGLLWHRKDIIKEIALHYEIHLWGDSAWEWLVGRSKAVYHGRMDCGIDKDGPSKLYSATKININLQSGIYGTGVSYRTFTIPSCGAFMVSNFRAELLELFEKEEVVYFKEAKELDRLIGYYLRHPDERKEISKRARERVLKEHTFLHRMKKLIGIMEDSIGK
jgi:spore maturation protein CgeB